MNFLYNLGFLQKTTAIFRPERTSQIISIFLVSHQVVRIAYHKPSPIDVTSVLTLYKTCRHPRIFLDKTLLPFFQWEKPIYFRFLLATGKGGNSFIYFIITKCQWPITHLQVRQNAWNMIIAVRPENCLILFFLKWFHSKGRNRRTNGK